MKIIYHVGLLCLVVISSGCLSIPNPDVAHSSSIDAEDIVSMEAATGLQNNAIDREGVLQAIEAFQGVIERDPDNIEAWERAANLHLLLGAAYESKSSAKRKAFREAMVLCTEAMMIDPDFAASIKDGAMVWEAAEDLDKEYIAPISLWSTALFYQYDECLSKSLKPFNLRWIRRTEKMLGYAYRLNPDWGGGQLHFSYGIYYLMPKVAGGDLAKSEDCFALAIEAGNGWILNRWGRARYLYKHTGNDDALIEDLKWVIAQDPYAMKSPACWNVFIQRDAREILDKKGIKE